MNDSLRRERWRLILGREADDQLGALSGDEARMDAALDFLYGRESDAGRNERGAGRDRAGGDGPSSLTTPEWINEVHRLFPKETIEQLEADALERYQLSEMVTDRRVLEQAQPSEALLRAVLQTKHLMNPEVLDAARTLVRRVVEQLMAKLAKDIRQPFRGVRDRRRRTTFRVARNFDLPTTLRRNLKHYDPLRRRVGLEVPYFFSRVRRHMEKWRVIILVDQSGSMVGSVIHSAITASIFKSLPNIRTHLIAFDTQIVDLTDWAGDPVETLMKVQLGGGTDIGLPLRYAQSLIDDPRRSIVVLITDLFDGAPASNVLSPASAILESGAHLLVLAALDENAQPTFDRSMGQRLANIGASVGAMTPGELANWVAAKVT